MAECSTGRNPLAQFSKHVSSDKSLQHDRLGGQLPVGPESQMRTGGPEMAAADKQMLENFYGAQPQAPMQAPSPFAFDEFRQALPELRHQQPPPFAAAHPEWASEFGTHTPVQQAQPEAQGAGFNTDEFAAFQTAGTVPVDVRMQSPMPQSAANYYSQFRGYNLMNGNLMSSRMPYQNGMQNQYMRPEVQQQEGKGKQVLELSDDHWEEQFKQLDDQSRVQGEELLKAQEEAASRGDSGYSEGDFQSIWDGIQKEQEAAKANIADIDWDNEIDANATWSPEMSNTTSMPRLGQYMFEPENPYMQHADPFSEGKRLVETGGNLSLAALAFEAAVQQDQRHTEAWVELGNAQAMNEKETPAIRAYEAAQTLDQTHLGALMGLAVSYTNEGYETAAYATLENWLENKYPAIVKAAEPAPAGTMDRLLLQDRVTNLFIQAAQLTPEGEAMDADVQVGLGVLFYGAEEYDKAVDCFSAALASSSTSTSPEHLLWNRLGATLANSGRSEEAINAYERALTINPNFVRARYNLGVSCINIGCFHQAAEHLLGALAMHRVAEEKARSDARGLGVAEDKIIAQNQSTNLFDTLRRVFGQMNRRDLMEGVGADMDLESYRKEFEF